MAMQMMRKGAFSGVLKIFFMTLLVLATGGLVLTDVGGFFRGGVSGNDVAKVGGQGISIQSFDNTVRRTLPQIGISPQEAYELGYLTQLLNGEIQNVIIHQTARESGIEVSDELVAQQIADIIEPFAGDNPNKQEVLDQILLSQGLSEQQFIAQIKRETASGLLNDALASALSKPSDTILETLYLYENETRDVELITFPNDQFPLQEQPAEEDLQTAYEGLKENYAIPENRSITIIALDDKKLEQRIDITEDQLQAIYDEDKNAFLVNETRTVEQAILEEESDARKVTEKLESGQSLKTAVEAITGDDSAYRGESEFNKRNTLDEIRGAVFKDNETGKALGPVQTALGWHVFIVKEITPPYMKPFESVRDDIRQEQLELQLIDQKFELSNILDDLLASGASLDEIKNEIEVSATPIENITAIGETPDGEQALTDYGEDSAAILEETFALQEGQSSPVFELQDGRFIAVRLDRIIPKTYQPYADLKDEIRENWLANEKSQKNRARVKKLLESGEDLNTISTAEKRPIRSLQNIKRDDDAPAPLIGATLPQIFEAALNEPFMLDVKEGIALVQVTQSKFPDAPKEEALEELAESMQRQETAEVRNIFVESKRQDYGVSINETLLRQMYGPASTNF